MIILPCHKLSIDGWVRKGCHLFIEKTLKICTQLLCILRKSVYLFLSGTINNDGTYYKLSMSASEYVDFSHVSASRHQTMYFDDLHYQSGLNNIHVHTIILQEYFNVHLIYCDTISDTVTKIKIIFFFN